MNIESEREIIVSLSKTKVMKGIYMTDLKTNYYPFWKEGKESISINTSKLINFLNEQGFGNYQTMEGRIQNYTLFYNNNGVLQLHSPNSVKKWLIDYVEKDEKSSDEIKEDIQDKIIKIPPSTINNYLQSLHIWSDKEFNDSKKLKIFRDDSDNCYIPFKNGVVHITATKIELVPRDELIEKGNIWESSILRHDVSVLDKYMVTENNVFKNYITYGLKKDIEPLPKDNDINLGTDNDRFRETLEAFETGFGYLIHSYNPPQEQKVVVFIDVDSSPDRTEGGNGKSLSMEQIKNYRNYAYINGKQFKKSLNDSSRFNFSNVKIDTGFIFIDDLNPDFDLRTMFSDITGDLTVEGKGINKIIIPKDRKPKMGITTNYVITGVGNSFERRQHIVEFGNFWNVANKKKICPSKILGKLVGTDFNEKDWNKFFNYGFYCVQKYLRQGLVQQSLNSYMRKNLVSVIEGVEGNGEVLDWMEEWISTTRIENNYHIDGIAVDTFYHSFSSDNPSLMITWDSKRLLDRFFDYVKQSEDLDWNPKLSSNGDTRSKRRMRIGSRGEQKEIIQIVSKNDVTI